MNDVLAIDIASDHSEFGLYSRYGEVLLTPITIYHKRHLLEQLLDTIQEKTKTEVDIILESTSIYHLPISNFFIEHGYHVIVLNPIISSMFKSNLRKIKTDSIDCHNLAQIYFTNLYNKQFTVDKRHQELMYMSRQHDSLSQSQVRYKNRLRQILSVVFPEYKDVLPGNRLYERSNLEFLLQFPHPVIIRNTRIDRLANFFSTRVHRKMKAHQTKARTFKDIAKDSLYAVGEDSEYVYNLQQILKLILALTTEIDVLKVRLITKATILPGMKEIQSIPGIGSFTAALLLAELGDLNRFDNISKVKAYCGLHPKVYQSGNTINHSGRLVKTGNKLARKHLYNATMGILRYSSINDPDNVFRQYYLKKRNDGKHHYAAVVATSTKLLNVIYVLCTRNTLFK
jgi:transposase